MARIAFVQYILYEYLGTTYLSSMLGKKDHEVDIFLKHESDETLLKEVLTYQPDIVAFSCTTGIHKWCLKFAGLIKNYNPRILILFGGPHPTFFPEIIEHSYVDMVCRGEGEYAMLELAEAITQKRDISKIQNLWAKKDGMVIKNSLRPLIKDLDDLPFPDRELYYRKYRFLNGSLKAFMTTRGCPYRCSFCFNHILQEMYKGKGAYVRRRSVDNVIAEIKEAKDRYKFKTVYIQDDVFILNQDWVNEFAERYKKEINLPFLCHVRADILSEEMVKKLKFAGCHSVSFGIESGNEKLRNRLLHKEITDEMIVRTANLLKIYGIRFRAYNMLGLPGERIEEALETVKINTRVGTDYPWCSIYQPYPKTTLGEYAQKHRFVEGAPDQMHASFFRDSMIKSEQKKELVNLQKLFFYAVKFPTFLPFIKQIIKLPSNLIFHLLFLGSYGYTYLKSENITLRETFTLGITNLKNFFFDTLQ